MKTNDNFWEGIAAILELPFKEEDIIMADTHDGGVYIQLKNGNEYILSITRIRNAEFEN